MRAGEAALGHQPTAGNVGLRKWSSAVELGSELATFAEQRAREPVAGIGFRGEAAAPARRAEIEWLAQAAGL